ncbi:MAG: xanthine dehydrogenase accessory protein XdhC, partial [Alicycliphilus sp.]|nr:xanthine dehydrogenase accessory protein XdhC [Alicycliphilus sp.]
MTVLHSLLERIKTTPACLVRVESIQGSAPREAGAWMAVFAGPAAPLGTIGGGHLELQAMQEARERLTEYMAGRAPRAPLVRCALGPRLGQCCGGVVQLRFECVGAADVPALRQRLAPRLQPVALFGGGHVGHALARVLAPLPFALHWIDSRDEVFPT